MPAKSQKKEAPVDVDDGPQYPSLEAFVERSASDDVGAAFGDIRAGLKAVKGPKAEHAKKIDLAIDHAEALLTHLLTVREQLEAQRKGGPKGRK